VDKTVTCLNTTDTSTFWCGTSRICGLLLGRRGLVIFVVVVVIVTGTMCKINTVGRIKATDSTAGRGSTRSLLLLLLLLGGSFCCCITTTTTASHGRFTHGSGATNSSTSDSIIVIIRLSWWRRMAATR
jgi:hypothetical protein